jgi:hypothetical protein
MSDRRDDTPPTRRHQPFFSTWSPRTGPILGNDCPSAIGVLAVGEAMPIGIAYPVGLVEHRRGTGSDAPPGRQQD